MKLQKMPDSMAGFSVDLKDPSRLLISGAYEETVLIDGSERRFITYLAPGMHNNQNVVVVVPPAKEDPFKFLKESGLCEFADKNQVFVSLLVAEHGAWDFSGRDADYMNAVNVQIQARVYYVTLLGDNIYAYGIGDGADIAHQACMKSTSQWSGLGTIGNITEAAMLNSKISAGGEDCALDEAAVLGTKCQLPVWMVFPKEGDSERRVIEYWCDQNEDRGEVLCGGGADMIYMPLPAVKYSQVNEEQIAQVRITLNQGDSSFGLLNQMWNYVGAARRHRSFGQKALRYYRDPLKLGAVRHTMEVDGLMREWYEYVPEAMKDHNEEVPLVVCMHGRGADGNSFFDISALNSVAEERKFIAVFPTASLFQQKLNGVKNVTLWDEDIYTADRDVKFIRKMIADIKKRNRIDSGRVYACGQSSGGRMSTVLGGAASDIFTAVAPWSAMHAMEDPTPILPQNKIPYLVIYGDKDPGIAGDDNGDGAFKMAPNTKAYRDALIAHLGLKEEPLHYKCGEISYEQYVNRDGIPMLTFGIVENMPHSNFPRESWISYDEFFAKYNRGKDGTLYYMGKAVE